MSGNLFQPRAPGDVAVLVDAYPLAWIVTHAPHGLDASTLPILAHRDENGAIIGFEGHFPRASAQIAHLQANPRALILCLGPHGYISPSWVRDRAWGPTWNFAQAQFETTVVFDDAPAAVEAHLRKLVAHMEQGRPGAWSPDEMGARFASLAARVTVFHAAVVRAQPRFKLGQDERREIFADICDALGEDPLRALMEKQNA